MGTNFYLRTLPVKYKQNALIKAIQTNDFDVINKLKSSMYDTIPDYPDKEDLSNFGYLHLGKRSGGWRFLWNPHVYRFIKNVDGKYVPEFVQLYPFTKKGITNYLHSFTDAYVVSEYALHDKPMLAKVPKNESELVKDEKYLQLYEDLGQWSIDGFLQMAFNWGKEYTPDNQYANQSYIFTSYPEWDSYIRNKYKNIITTHADYWNDNLRFASTNNFS